MPYTKKEFVVKPELSRRERILRFHVLLTSTAGTAISVRLSGRWDESLSSRFCPLGIDYQRLDLIVCDREMVVERDRGTRK
jgi:hypothetical protein